MNNKFLRFITLFLEVFCLALIAAICIYGILVDDRELLDSPFLHSAMRLAIIFLMTISYYKTSVSNFNPGNAFLILFLLFMSIVELRILSIFTSVTGLSILPPRVSVRLHLFAQLMVYFLLAGYALNYQNNDHGAITRFIILGMTGCLFLSLAIPATQDILGVWKLDAPFLLITVFCATSLFSNLILAFSEPTKLGVFRQISMMMLLLGNYAMTFSDFTAALIGSCTFIVGGFIYMILTLRTSVIL